LSRIALASFTILCLLSATSALIINPANANGTTYFNQTYGGISNDRACSVVQAVDGGYVLAGSTHSFGAGGNDFWLVKTDSSGNHEWNKTYGGLDYDWAYSMVQAVDGGYVLAGYTHSFGAGNMDVWLVKTDASGNHEWNKTYGGLSTDEADPIVETVDGGYVLAGCTRGRGAWVEKV